MIDPIAAVTTSGRQRRSRRDRTRGCARLIQREHRHAPVAGEAQHARGRRRPRRRARSRQSARDGSRSSISSISARGGLVVTAPRPDTDRVRRLAVHPRRRRASPPLAAPPRPRPRPCPGRPNCPVLPPGNVWNTPVDTLPRHPDSARLVRSIGLDDGLHPDFSDQGRYGIPINVVGRDDAAAAGGASTTPANPTGCATRSRPRPRIEGGSDRHVLLLDRDACRLYELFAAERAGGALDGRVRGGLRPALQPAAARPGWTSADAAGLPILPGLARYDEVARGGIDHALRFTAPRTRNALRLPGAPRRLAARPIPALPPMGLRVRLKRSVSLAGYGPQARAVLTALKRYGMILADNGSPWYVTGAPERRLGRRRPPRPGAHHAAATSRWWTPGGCATAERGCSLRRIHTSSRRSSVSVDIVVRPWRGRSRSSPAPRRGSGVTFADGAGRRGRRRRPGRPPGRAPRGGGRARSGRAGRRALPVACDVTDPEQVEAAVARAVAEFGRIDVLVANAGSVPEGFSMPEKLPAELFAQSIDVNLNGTWNTCQSVGRQMLRQGEGSIVIISSYTGLAGVPHFPPAYQAAKAALINISKSLAVSWADRGVRVNALAPGLVPQRDDRPGARGAALRCSGSTTRRRSGGRAARRSSSGALLLLASDASSYMTGSTITVDGGTSASVGATPYSEELFGLHAAVMPAGLGERIMPEPAAERDRRGRRASSAGRTRRGRRADRWPRRRRSRRGSRRVAGMTGGARTVGPRAHAALHQGVADHVAVDRPRGADRRRALEAGALERGDARSPRPSPAAAYEPSARPASSGMALGCSISTAAHRLGDPVQLVAPVGVVHELRAPPDSIRSTTPSSSASLPGTCQYSDIASTPSSAATARIVHALEAALVDDAERRVEDGVAAQAWAGRGHARHSPRFTCRRTKRLRSVRTGAGGPHTRRHNFSSRACRGSRQDAGRRSRCGPAASDCAARPRRLPGRTEACRWAGAPGRRPRSCA